MDQNRMDQEGALKCKELVCFLGSLKVLKMWVFPQKDYLNPV